MTWRVARALALTLLTLVVVANLVVIGWIVLTEARVIPACQEDEFIRGVGNFDHGYWSTYQCADGDPQ
jgi:hypothetical protein